MQNAEDFRIVFITTETYESAKHIAKILITEKLAACCSIIQNVTSFFGWQGTLNERHEYLLLIKTSQNCLEHLEVRVQELHEDEIPEIIAIKIDCAAESYKEWMKESIM